MKIYNGTATINFSAPANNKGHFQDKLLDFLHSPVDHDVIIHDFIIDENEIVVLDIEKPKN